jgi:hypothetical protein
VVYTQPYPEFSTTINGVTYNTKGSIVNIGSHAGVGIEYKINNDVTGFTTLRIFHVSNGKPFVDNPAVDAIGMVMGLQF